MLPNQETNQAIADDPEFFELQVWIAYQQRYYKYLQDKVDTLTHILHDVQQLRETHALICEKIEELSRAYGHKKSPPHHAGGLSARGANQVASSQLASNHTNLSAVPMPQKKTDASGGDAGARHEIKQHPESTSRIRFVNPILTSSRGR